MRAARGMWPGLLRAGEGRAQLYCAQAWMQQARFYAEEAKEADTKETETKDTEKATEAEASTNGSGGDTQQNEADPMEALKQELEQAKQEVKKLQEGIQRFAAEAENARHIAKRDVENAKSFGIEKFAKELLTPADSLSLALKNTPMSQVESIPEVKTLYTGVSMTRDQLFKVFSHFDIVEEDPMGKEFNPDRHEALFRSPYAEGKTPGTIDTVICSTYTFRGRVIRAAKVGVVSDPQ